VGAVSYTLQVSTTSSFGSFVYNLSGLRDTTQLVTALSTNTKYYWRSQATNNVGTSGYSTVYDFTTGVGGTMGTPCPGVPTVTYEGKIYNTVLVGAQCWLKENLNVGISINGNKMQTPGNGIIEKYCYANYEADCNSYGGLYLWDEAMNNSTVSGARGICPAGWHIPTSDEFQVLINTAGNNPVPLVEVGQGHGSGTNYSGFSALLGGGHSFEDPPVIGFFSGRNVRAYFWCSTGIQSSFPFHMIVSLLNSNINLYTVSKYEGYSVRCIKD
jgi:uncharacterized protein (TIGR02145 family)